MKICSVCKRCFDEPADSCIEVDHPPFSDSRNGDRLMVTGYSLDQLLASSVKADTYRARRLDCGRSCIIRIASTDPNGEERFLRDAHLASTLFDARVADIYEVGSLRAGECFVVEEDCDEPTLRSRLDTVGIPDLLTSVRIVEQAAEALHALHLKGLTHGAVRPENIHLDFDAEGLPILKLSGADLGGVTAHNAISNKFLIDSSLHAIKYFAPEQCSGEAATPQTDVYSLGIVFYELVAGVPPFDAPKASALISMHLSQRPPDVKIEDLELRMLVAHSLSESLQKQPSFRQSSADLFARQMRLMEQLATHVSTPPPAVTVPAAPPKPQTVAFTSPAPAPVPAPAPAPVEVRNEYAVAAEPVAEARIAFECPSETIAEAAYESEVLPSIEFEREPVYEIPTGPEHEEEQFEFSESSDTEEPELVSLNPHSRRSALVAHRQRLKLRNRRSRSLEEPKPVKVEVPVTAIQAKEEPDPIDTSLPIVEIQAANTETSTDVPNESAPIPKLIEWEQPDDIPSLDDIPDDIPAEPFVPTPASMIPEVSASLHQPEAHLIQWEQPEDDIPSIEDVIEVQLQEGISNSSIFQFKPEDVEVVTEFQHRLSADLMEAATAGVPEQKRGSSPHTSAEIEFVPTILGAKNLQTETNSRHQYESIFSTYEAPVKTRRPVPYRSILVGIGLMSVATLLGLGGDPVWRFISTPSVAEPETAVATTEKQNIPIQRIRPSLPDPIETESEPPVIEEFVPPGSPDEHISASRGPEPSRPNRSLTKPSRQVRTDPAPATAASQSSSVPFSPSTVVITYGKGSVHRSDSRANRSSEKEARSTAESSAGATRPRIVPAPQR